MALFKKHLPTTILGLALDSGHLDVVIAHRSGSTAKLLRTLRIPLTLDPLTNDPELVGREIRNALDEAQIRERVCVFCVPAAWTLTIFCKLPQMPESDVKSFMQLEAEQGFPYAPQDLIICSSRLKTAGNNQYVSQVAVPQNHIALITKVLHAAKLDPVGFSTGITALESIKTDSDEGVLALAAGELGVEMLAYAGGGIASLRALEGTVEVQGSVKQVDGERVARDIRITLGQLPNDLRESIKMVHLFGKSEFTRPIQENLEPLARSFGLKIQLGSIHGNDPLLSEGGYAMAFGLASKYLVGPSPEMEFLPPKVSKFDQLITRFTTKKIAYAGMAAAVVLLWVGGSFSWQQYNISRLDAEWSGMKSNVTHISELKQKTHQFRSWFDETATTMRIMRQLTEAFPEDGSVSAKLLQIKDLSEISCSGQARDNQSWLRMLDRLRASRQIADLKFQSVRGTSPMQFNLSFRWVEGGTHD